MLKRSIKRYAEILSDRKKAMEDAKRKGIDENLQSMGYGGLEDFNAKNPQLDVNAESMLTTGLKKVVRGVKKIIKRYVKD